MSRLRRAAQLAVGVAVLGALSSCASPDIGAIIHVTEQVGAFERDLSDFVQSSDANAVWEDITANDTEVIDAGADIPQITPYPVVYAYEIESSQRMEVSIHAAAASGGGGGIFASNSRRYTCISYDIDLDSHTFTRENAACPVGVHGGSRDLVVEDLALDETYGG